MNCRTKDQSQQSYNGGAMLESFRHSLIRLEPDNFTHNPWGGEWIPQLKGLPRVNGPVGESWEFSTHRDRPNKIRLADGSLVTLRSLTGRFAEEILGGPNAEAPFLLKFIDSKDDLSLQVHPSDEYARTKENDSGKTESWIILDTMPGSENGFIYLGFN